MTGVMRGVSRWGMLIAALAAAWTASRAGAAREPIGLFEGWAAFRDDRPRRCFAIAEPARHDGGGRWRPFASVAYWPAARVRGQLHIRLRAMKQRGAPVFLTIGEQRFQLVAGGADAWAPDARVDAAIIGTMRSGSSMSVETRASGGRPFADVYRLRGAATAIDAAALGCARG